MVRKKQFLNDLPAQIVRVAVRYWPARTAAAEFDFEAVVVFFLNVYKYTSIINQHR